MTKLRHPWGRAAGSKVHAEASSPSDNALYVNLNNGNVNYNNQSNSGLVRPVRRVAAGECQGAAGVSLQTLYRAKRVMRRGKKPSADMLAFETRSLDRMLHLQDRMNSGTWEPSATVCSIAARPKAREIHAPTYADRIVHHYLVPILEAIFEPSFIFDSYGNRVEKGTHRAVERLTTFARQVHSGQGGGYFLQLDIHNFFNSIHRPTLWGLMKPRLLKAGAAPLTLQLTHSLLRRSPLGHGVHYRATESERALVPAHKRLANAAPGCGLPIGNLSSQFFANVYLDVLDQFIKRELRAQRYVRYVDDFVLIHESREQLVEWLGQIERFLDERLHLRLKQDIRLQPLTAGIDFLGYVIRPTHTLVRPRVIQHAREALYAWQQGHVQGRQITATPEQLRAVSSTWSSYTGHFRHAQSHRLQVDFHRRYPWLHSVTGVRRRFRYRDDGRPFNIPFGAPRA